MSTMTANDSTKDDIIAGHVKSVEAKVEEGWQPFLVTWTFKPLHGSNAEIERQMRDGICYTYETFVVRAGRRPLEHIRDLPVLVATTFCPGHPGGFIAVVCEPQRRVDGLSAPGVLVVPGVTRLDTSVVEHVAAHQREVYAHPDTPIERMYVMPIGGTPAAAVEYVFESVRKGRTSIWRDVVSLPGGRSEQWSARRPRFYTYERDFED